MLVTFRKANLQTLFLQNIYPICKRKSNDYSQKSQGKIQHQNINMLDLFTIFSKGGIVLWYFQGTSQSFTTSVNALIKSVILQVRNTQISGKVWTTEKGHGKNV